MQTTPAVSLICLLFGTSMCYSEPSADPGPEMTKSGIVLIDGNSSYTFSKDGCFTSRPILQGGRTFTGKWKISEGQSKGAAKVIVEAKMGWQDGIQPSNIFRRIVFTIYPGRTVRYILPDDLTGELAEAYQTPKEHFKTYWIIDELTAIKSISISQQEAKPDSRSGNHKKPVQNSNRKPSGCIP